MPNPFVETPARSVQDEAVSVMNAYYQDAKRLTKPRRDMQVKIYQDLSTFEQAKNRGWDTSFRVNKGFVALTKWVSRLFANRFKWQVSRRMTVDGKKIPQEDLEAINDVLTFIFDREDVWARLKMWGKKMLAYGEGWATPRFEMRTNYLGKDVLTNETAERITQDRGISAVAEEPEQTVVKINQGQFEEEFLDEFPTIDPESFSDVYADPRYLFADEIPAVMTNKDKVRWASILRNRKIYFNLDKVDPKAFDGMDWGNESKVQMYNIQQVTGNANSIGLDTNAINIKRYYGVFSPTGKPEDEKLFKLTGLANGSEVKLLIQMKEISEIPWVLMKCFEDTETLHAFGVVEPQKGVEDELNFSKNSKAAYINAALNRNWLYSPKSGVNPDQLTSAPGNIIVCKDGVPIAKTHLEQLEMPQINNDAFTNENDMERQYQQLTFQTDVSSPRTDQALTNTATGVRATFFEASAVINDVRRNMEAAVVEMAYQMLALLFDNISDSWVVERVGEEKYFRIHKTLFSNPRKKYNIRIEAASSTFDSVEQRRADAIAFWNFNEKARAAGVPVNTTAVYKEVVDTFEKRKAEDFISPAIPGAGGAPGGAGGGAGAISAAGGKAITEAAAPPNQAKVEAQEITGSI